MKVGLLYTLSTVGMFMAKGITTTSAIITISGTTDEVVAGTMFEEQVPLQLDILNREVLLVYAIDLNVTGPAAIAGTDTATGMSLSATTRTTLGNIGNTNVLGSTLKQIRAAGFVDGGVGFTEISPETPTSNALDYVGIISTNDFFVQIASAGQPGVASGNWRMWCARAKVTADIYAALVQGETLSA